MLNATFARLDQWSGPRSQDRKRAPFKVGYLRTLDLLEYELSKLGAHHVVVQIEDPEAQKGLRNNGTFVSSASNRFTPNRPGVVLNFESDKGTISMPCDRYSYWQDNLRAIALSLEALRAVDRYGVTRGNEQYKGWTALPDPHRSNGKMTREEALIFMAAVSTFPKDQIRDMAPLHLRELLRTAKAANHPDHGTDDADRARRNEMFVLIGQAQAILCGEGGK